MALECDNLSPIPGTQEQCRQLIVKWLPAIAGACAFLAMLPEALAPVRYAADLGVQLQAATRLLAGKGLTTCAGGAFPLDIARPEYHHLVLWPPGLSFLVAGLMRIGLSMPAAVVLYKMVAYVAGWAGAAILARRIIPGYNGLLLFFLMVTPLGRIVHTGPFGPTDVILWAILPYWVIAVLTLWNLYRDDRSLRRVLPWCALLGGLAFGGFLFRWAGAFLLPATIVCILIGAWSFRRRWFLPCLVALAVWAAPAGMMLSFNRANTGGMAPLIRAQHAPPLSLKGVKTLEPLVGLLGEPFEVLHNLQKLDVSNGSVLVSLLALPLVGLALRDLRRAIVRDPRWLDSPAAQMRLATAVAYLFMAGLLLAFSLRYPGEGINNAAGNPRYYTPLALCLIIVVVYLVVALQSAARPGTRTYMVSIACATLLGMSVLLGAYRVQGLRLDVLRSDGIHPLRAWVSPEEAAIGQEASALRAQHVFITGDRYQWFIAEDKYPAYWWWSEDADVARLHTSSPTLLCVVLPPTTSGADAERNASIRASLQPVISRFDLQRLPSKGDCEVYSGMVGPN